MTFGKHAGAKVHEMASDLNGYLRWMLKKGDFPPHVLGICNVILKTGGGSKFLTWAAATYPPPALPPVAVEPEEEPQT